jgi:hypothetical protein
MFISGIPAYNKRRRLAMAFLAFLLAFGIPVYLLYHFHSQSWFWHVLAIVAALSLGFVQTPPEWKSKTFDLLFGSTFVFLLVWGVGGLLPVFHHHHEKHA